MPDNDSKIEYVGINYAIGTDPNNKDTVRICLTGTGINLEDKAHEEFMKSLVQVIGSQMFAKAQGIPHENITTKLKEQ